MSNLKGIILIIALSALIASVCTLLSIELIYVQLVGSMIFAGVSIYLFGGKPKSKPITKCKRQTTRLPPKK